ncbi:MAG: hypothetical protein CMI53_03010 [Parcubacteria group bacterium]|jgi:phosphatidylglycerophosphate synthase|nr:hypothetical protein [Parcubacteria group bacterium]|tara:strand:- start:11643 stop:12308 length:666 start_codon:yes stop_codon:yes gene_type:complete
MRSYNPLIRPFIRLEVGIEQLLKFLFETKERILLPLIRNHWPDRITPNNITWLRFFGALVILFLLILSYDYHNSHLFAVIFVALCLTDLLDGLVARAKKLTSREGAYFEKVSDKLLVVPLGCVEYWSVSKPLVIISLLGVTTVIVTATYKLLHNSDETPDNVIGKFGMTCYCAGVVIGIYPDWIEVGKNICWGGVYLGGAAIVINFRQHFKDFGFWNGKSH